jgi:hypothetical protein
VRPVAHGLGRVHRRGFGEELTPEQHALFTTCTGRDVAPTAPVNELWLVCGRRAGRGNGRVYRVDFRADDGLGGVCSGSVSVIVPKNMKFDLAVIDDGQRYDSTRR